MSPTLRIAMISYHTCPLAAQEGKETGGMNIYVLELAKALGAQGHQVDIFTRSQDPSNAPIVSVTDQVRVIHLQAGPPAYLSKKEVLMYISDFAKALQTFVADEAPYDVVHAHYFQSGMVAMACRPNWAPPLFMTYHTLGLMKNLVARTEAEQETTQRIAVEQELAQVADRIIILSESEAKYLKYLHEVPEEKIVVIPPGFDPEVFHKRDRSAARQEIGMNLDHKVLMWVGRVEPLKGIDALLFAVKILQQRLPDLPVCLWIVGGENTQQPDNWPAEQKKLHHLQHQLKLSTSVTFAGRQTQEMLPEYLNAADVVVMPSHYESFGMAALEAMACGTPVITTNVAGVSALIDDHHKALITTVNNPLLLATQIERLLTDTQTYQTIQNYLSKQVTDLTWEHIAHQVADAYASIRTT